MNETSEEEYVATLEHQRHMYQWCLENLENTPPQEARERAAQFYRYQPADAAYRTLVFHDEAWHWAMLHTHGEGYWERVPELAEPTPAYEQEWQHSSRDPEQS